MENVIIELQEWTYLKELPANLYGFRLELNMRENGALYEIFAYANVAGKRRFSVVFDSATKDFLVRITVGLTEFCDISFICTKLVLFEAVLKERMETTLQNLAGGDNNKAVCTIFKQKKILDWPYALQLPEQLLGFRLFIRPTQPLKVINGSYIIIDYSDFSVESNLIIYYNVFRDEFFGEARIRKTPQMTTCFDAEALEVLAEKLKLNLENVLNNIRTQLSELT